MEVIHGRLENPEATLACIPLRVDRLTLSKRRWRGTAADGREFGFDLDHPMTNGDVFFQEPAARYEIEQRPEPVLEVSLAAPEDAARLGWKIGNLHFQIAVANGAIHAPDDPAIRHLLEREGVAYKEKLAVFQPLGGGHAHEHHGG